MSKFKEPWFHIIEETMICPTIDDVVETVCEHYGVTATDLRSQRRAKGVVDAKKMTAYLCGTLTFRSFPLIGRRLHRDQSTLATHTRDIKERLSMDAGLRGTVELLTSKIGGIRETHAHP